ncbi:hypothetical protein F9C11_20430 [Amycolatopsis sp. VS8301801F10]|uniref:hypothetical protein n=1 Tax=unclassified Amycolatopsis TaxID=2618356 RepID=UPI0038FC3AA8
MPDQTENASERPNAGQETARADVLRHLIHLYEIDLEQAEKRASSWWEAAKDIYRRSRAEAAEFMGTWEENLRQERARADAAAAELRDVKAQLEEWTLQENDQARRADAAEAKLRDAEKIRFNVDRILDDALGPNVEDGAGMGLAGEVALLAERKKAVEDRLDQVRVVLLEGGQDAASVRREALAVVLGESDRIGHRGDHQRRAKLAEERLAQALELCKQACTERDADRAKLDEIRAVIAEAYEVIPVTTGIRMKRWITNPPVYFDRIREVVERTTTETDQPSLAAADAWARECDATEERLAEAQETAAAEVDAERSAYDMDPDIDEPEDEEDSRG